MLGTDQTAGGSGGGIVLLMANDLHITGAVSASANTYTGPLVLSSTVSVQARTLNGSEWSALNEAPNEIAIRYALAVALSYTTRRDETIQQFRIVVSRGEPSSTEVKAAREWLASVNGLEDTSVSVMPSIAQAEGRAAKTGRVLGRIQWHDIDPYDRMVRISVSLTGEDVATRMTRPFKIGRPYEFRNVPPGSYRLVAEVGGTPMWDVKIDVSADNDTPLDLTDANSTVPKDFDPTSS